MSQPQFPLAIDDLRNAGGRAGRSTRSSSPSPTCRAGSRASGSTRSSSSTPCSEHGTEGCNYLLAVDVDMNTVDGYEISSWSRGYGDMEFVLDLSTFRLVHRGCRARRWCSATWPGSTRTTPRWLQSPRTILKKQVDRAAGHGLVAFAGTELEFNVYNNTLRGRLVARLPGPHPRQTSTTSTTRSSAPAASSRCCATSATTCTPPGSGVESAKGECNLGQHEIAFNYEEVVRTADQHSVYKNGAKEIASLARPGRHLHGEVRRARGQLLPHPHERARRRRQDRLRRGRRADQDVRALRGRRAGDARRLHAALRAEHQLLQALRGGVLRADRHRVGSATTARARSGSSDTVPGCGSRTACPAAT